jgi:hypothetical protein
MNSSTKGAQTDPSSIPIANSDFGLVIAQTISNLERNLTDVTCR